MKVLTLTIVSFAITIITGTPQILYRVYEGYSLPSLYIMLLIANYLFSIYFVEFKENRS